MSRLLVLVLAVLWAGPAAAQPPRAPRPLENIKVLTGWTGAEVREEMRRMGEAIGVKRDHRHVQGNFASDEKRAKHTARRMLQLTLALNAEHFPDARTGARRIELGRVTCYTCHQARPRPS